MATDGWSKMTGHDVVDLARKFEDYGVEGVIYTDIGRDGMLSGVNIVATVKLAREIKYRDRVGRTLVAGRHPPARAA